MKIEAEKHENEERLRHMPKRAELEKELRESALSTPICEDSKGFALLAKMGYKPGMSLGKKKEGIAFTLFSHFYFFCEDFPILFYNRRVKKLSLTSRYLKTRKNSQKFNTFFA